MEWVLEGEQDERTLLLCSWLEVEVVGGQLIPALAKGPVDES